jgi:hypothetical protein
MEKKTVYIETSIVSYFTARPTKDLLAAAWQKITSDWWDTQRSRFSLYTSSLVTEEAARGNPDAASRRLNALSDIQLPAITEAAVALSKALLQDGALPKKALDDSLQLEIERIAL